MSDYTPDQLKTIIQAPMMTGLAVAMVDMGLVSTAIEAAALSKQMAGAAAKYPQNSVIQAALSEASLKHQTVKLDQPKIKPEDVEAGAIIDTAIADINRALQVLEDKATPEEIAQYKQFIYDCGQAVAEAAGSGLFGTGAKVSAQEAAALERLKVALGV